MPETISSRVLTLIASIKAELAGRKSAGEAIEGEIEKVISLLEPMPILAGGFPRSRQAATRHIHSALQGGNDSTVALLALIRPVIRFLPWRYNYPLRDDAPDLEQNIAFAEIIGPEAPFRSDSVCLGLTLIGPKTLYPPHRHPAVELYLVAAGTATWTLDGVSREQPPGSCILHPSQAVHAMQTGAEPLLAIYSWSGSDVRTTSVYTPGKPVRFEGSNQTNPVN
jgi:quercetin dioxygenase-like cupin family protein